MGMPHWQKRMAACTTHSAQCGGGLPGRDTRRKKRARWKFTMLVWPSSREPTTSAEVDGLLGATPRLVRTDRSRVWSSSSLFVPWRSDAIRVGMKRFIVDTRGVGRGRWQHACALCGGDRSAKLMSPVQTRLPRFPGGSSFRMHDAKISISRDLARRNRSAHKIHSIAPR